MQVLLDGNVLLRSIQPTHPHSAAAQGAMLSLGQQRHELCVVPQILYEFWVVTTRPETVNGLGLNPASALSQIQDLLRLYTVLHDDARLFPVWLELVGVHGVSGKAAHDARLIAAMKVHAVPAILTFNGADFGRYTGIQVLDPGAVSGRSASS